MKKVTFYSFLMAGEERTQTEEFIVKFRNHLTYGRDFNLIMAAIKAIGNERGASEFYFRSERLGEALPPPYQAGDLRLYCSRFSDSIVILGNGGVKTSQAVQDSPDCLPHFEFINELVRELNYRIIKKDIAEIDGKLVGNLNFEICIEHE
jgi:hypothetical protein